MSEKLKKGVAMDKKSVKVIEKEEISQVAKESIKEPMPTLIKFNEFLNSMVKAKNYLPETLGGFATWMKREGLPKSLSFKRWKELLDEYSTRKV